MSRNEMFRAIARDDLALAARLVHRNVQWACETEPDSGRSALHEAAAQGRCAILHELMRYVASHPGRDRRGDTVLMLALRGGHFDCVEVVLARTPHLWPDDRDSVQALIDGGHDRGDIALALYQRDARLARPDGSVPTLAAAEARRLPAVAELIRQRIRDHEALVAACSNDDVAAIGALLDDQRAHVNELDHAGWPPLARAIAAKAHAAIDHLLERGASIDAWVPDRRTLTMLAVEVGPRTARYWIARCNQSWGDVQPPTLRAAIESQHDDAGDTMATLATLDPGRRDRLLQMAAWCGNTPMVERLRLGGARAASAAPAALWNDSTMLDRLHAASGSVNAAGRDGLPPLHLLALAETPQIALDLARRLAELGADLDFRHSQLGTAIEFAERLGQHALATHLRELAQIGKFRWQREARARGIARIRFYYDKADGVAFVPSNPDLPLEVGGDYDGAYAMQAARGLWDIQGRGLYDRLDPRQRAILDKLARGEDFGIDEALATVRHDQVEYRRQEYK